jgi:hypothetical protein
MGGSEKDHASIGACIFMKNGQYRESVYSIY